MPAEFQKAKDYTLIGLQITYCFLDDIIIVSTGTETNHLAYNTKRLKKLDEDYLRINLQKCYFAKTEVLNKAIHKNKYQMPNIDMLIDTISQHLTNTQNGQQAYFSILYLKYAYSQLRLHNDTAKHLL